MTIQADPIQQIYFRQKNNQILLKTRSILNRCPIWVMNKKKTQPETMILTNCIGGKRVMKVVRRLWWRKDDFKGFICTFILKVAQETLYTGISITQLRIILLYLIFISLSLPL